MLAPDVALHADHLVRWLEAGDQVWLSGPAGSGRTTLMRRLIDAMPAAVMIDLPSLDEADAGAVLSLLTSCAVAAEARERLIDAPFRAIVEAVVQRDATLIVRVPPSWGSSNSDPRHLRARSELSRLAAVRRLIWIADAGMEPISLGIRPDRRISLAAHRVPFIGGVDWSSYQGQSERLRRALPADLSTSPLLWRLAVGAVALGNDPRRVAILCAEHPSVSLLRMLDAVLESLEGRPDIAAAVFRFMQSRRPLPSTVALEIAGPPPEHEPLITRCLGYGEPVKMSSLLRQRLEVAWADGTRTRRRKASLRKAEAERTHYRLAEHNRAMDGVLQPTAARGWQEMLAWVEKVHHLAHAGDAGAEEWKQQRLPRRELYWDRARHLSVVCRNFEGASAVYGACLEQFPDDDYALHYRAYNQQRAHGRVTPEVLQGYDEAVEKAPENPWWNSRKITALIEAKRPIEARRAWARAIERIDPEGTRLETDPWLASHLHYWVVKAWFDSGAWCTARSILERIPEDIMVEVIRARPDLAQMQSQISEVEAREWSDFYAWLDQKQSDEAWRPVAAIVEALRDKVLGLPPPMAGEGEDGPNLVWSRPGVYVELEVLGADSVDWFAHDRLDDRRDGTDEPVSWANESLIQWLEQARRE